MMSWGHDEYMYQVLKHNKTTLPEEALYMIRYASGSGCNMALNLLFLYVTIFFWTLSVVCYVKYKNRTHCFRDRLCLQNIVPFHLSSA
jgi:hypothetical protein